MKKDGLTLFQRKLCHEYLIDFDGAKAARRAGSRAKNPEVVASYTFARPEVKDYLGKLMTHIEPDIKATAERVIKELSRLAFYDPADYFKRDKKGNLIAKDIDELTPDQRAAIIDYDPQKKILKLSTKDSSLDKLGRHFKLFTELHEQGLTFTVMPELKLAGQTVIFNVGQPANKK
jgi:phage terminase small subunit